MAILDRMSRLIRANINDLLDRSEDPEKMLNELLREMDSSIVEARSQVANTIAQEKELEADLQQSQHDAREWERRAELAVGAAKDDLAREALRRKRDAESIATVYACLLYTSDAADERSSVDLGGRRIITKKNTQKKTNRRYILTTQQINNCATSDFK